MLYEFIHNFSIALWGHLICGVISFLIDYFILKMYDNSKELTDYVNNNLEKSGQEFKVNVSTIIIITILLGYGGLYMTLKGMIKNRID